MNWLIDDSGEMWPATYPNLRRRLDFGPRSVEDCSRYLVTNLGYIAVATSRRGLIVRWRPTFVRRATFVSLILYLKDQPDKRVLVATLRRAWSDVLYSTQLSAQVALLKEFDTARCEYGGFFRSRPRALQALPPASLLTTTFSHAREMAFSFEAFDLWKMLDAHSVGRYILLDPQPEQQRLLILVQGQGYPNVGQDWLTGASGRDFFDQPDATYAKAAAKGYWSVMQSGEPLIEDVEASIWWTSRGRSDIRYTRLVLPIEVTGKRRLLLCVSQLRGGD